MDEATRARNRELIEDGRDTTVAAETWLRLLADEFWLEHANHAIGAHHACKYPSSTAATQAMLRQAYFKGAEDATAAPSDFDRDVAAVEAANARERERVAMKARIAELEETLLKFQSARASSVAE